MPELCPSIHRKNNGARAAAAADGDVALERGRGVSEVGEASGGARACSDGCRRKAIVRMTTDRLWRATIDQESDAKTKRERDTGRRRQVDMDQDQRPEIRVSDAEREQTVKVLERHHVDGRLTWEEFSERMEAAFHARTREDLRRTLADLPPLDEPRPPAERRARSGPDWRSLLTPPLVIAALIGLAVLLWAFGGGPPHRGFFPLFPLLFWVFVLSRFVRPRRRW